MDLVNLSLDNIEVLWYTTGNGNPRQYFNMTGTNKLEVFRVFIKSYQNTGSPLKCLNFVGIEQCEFNNFRLNFRLKEYDKRQLMTSNKDSTECGNNVSKSYDNVDVYQRNY